jgi:hypothetical protein
MISFLGLFHKLYLDFKENPIIALLVFVLLFAVFGQQDYIKELKSIRKEDADYYETEIQYMRKKVDECDSSRVRDLKDFNLLMREIKQIL